LLLVQVLQQRVQEVDEKKEQTVMHTMHIPVVLVVQQ
jgi:hypothetical protein